MWKVLIADDEPTIRSGIRTVIEDMDLPLSVCAEARNGEMALEQVKLYQPEIILADISMPRLNGIEMIRALRREKADIGIIIISGFDEFEYAKQAIELEVSAYLLKPVDVAELHSALEKVIAELEQQQRQDHFQILLRQQMEKHRAYFQGKLLNEWIEEDLPPAERSEQCQLLGIEFPEPSVLLMLGASERQLRYDIEGALSDRLICYTLTDIISQLLEPVGYHYVFTDRYKNIIALIEGTTWTVEQLIEVLREPVEKLLGEVCRIRGCQTNQANLAGDYQQLREQLSCDATYRPLVLQAQRYIIEHFGEPELDLPAVSAAIGSSPGYLSRLMKQEIGSSFKEFLSQVRINHAIGMMRTDSSSFYRIAEATGYRNQHYFSTAFKNMTGLSPSEYKKSILKKGEFE